MASFGAKFTACVGSVGLATAEHGTMVDVNRVYFDANVGMDCTSNNLAWCSSCSWAGWLSYRICQRRKRVLTV